MKLSLFKCEVTPLGKIRLNTPPTGLRALFSQLLSSGHARQELAWELQQGILMAIIVYQVSVFSTTCQPAGLQSLVEGV